MHEKKVLDSESNVILKLPAKSINLRNPIVIQQTKDSLSWKAIKIIGSGIEQTKIYASNGFIRANFLTRDILIEISDFTIIPAQINSGNGIQIWIPPGGNRHNRSIILKNLLIRGENANDKNVFETSINVTGAWRILISNVFITGPFGPNVEQPSPGKCFVLSECYSPEVANSACWSMDTGLEVLSETNPGPEGIQVISSKFVDVNIGIKIENSRAIEPEGVISNNHINAKKNRSLSQRKEIHYD